MPKNIEPNLKLIGDYLKLDKGHNFIIPSYQRGYSWTNDECDKLWTDILDFENLKTNDEYFFGTVIVDRQDDQYSLIYGQQRTTTFLLLAKALQIR